MNWIDRAVFAVAPGIGLRRARARRAGELLLNYDAASSSRRTKSWRPSSADADAASARRQRIAYVGRDMVRNAPFATRALQAIVSNTVGDGIIPSLDGARDGVKARFGEIVQAHFDTTAIDANGRLNLYGLQRLVMSTVAESGEALIRIRRRRLTDGLALPFQLEVLEPDYLDTGVSGERPAQSGGSGGNVVRDGIEYDAIGRRVAYWLFGEHPGAQGWVRGFTSRRVPASEVIHVFRVDRAGQQRGVSWFAPVAMPLQDLRDYFDAQLMRQKIAACFAAFRVTLDPDGDSATSATAPTMLAPGGVHQLGPGEDIRFSAPAPVDGLDEFTRAQLREIAAGIGITYEALTGDLSMVNYSSARMGRMEMDRNVSAWQWLLMVPQFLQPIGALTLEYWRAVEPTRDLRRAQVHWTPPARVIIDPSKEYKAVRDKIRAGLSSWQAEVRALGYDPETVAREMQEDAATFDRIGVSPESDPRRGADAASAQSEIDLRTSADVAD